MKETSPKKSLGQHWLHDEATLDSICDAAQVTIGDNVLEIGPGLGTLTGKLLQRGAHVTAVEFDSHLAQTLKQTLSRHSKDSPLKMGDIQNLKVVEGDILQFNLQQLPDGYKVVANIPYYLTSNLIRELCESPNHFSQAAILIQKEVAVRACARPGDMSLLSVSTQFYCEASLGVFVPKELFTPPPKVDSQVLLLHRRVEPLFSDVNEKQFFRLVRAGFSQKRKTMLNSLSGGLALPKPEVRALLETAHVSPSIRAQALSLENWHKLYCAAIDLGYLNP